MSEKELKLNIDVKMPDEIKSGLYSIEEKLGVISEKIVPVEIPEQKDYTQEFKDLSDKMDYEEEIVVKLNII